MLPQARLFTRVNKQSSVGMMSIRTVAFSRQLLTSSRCTFQYCNTINRQLCTSRTPACAQEITKTVKSYGKLYVNLPWSVEVKPTDPHRYPDMDTIVVKISSSTSSDANLQKLLNIFAADEICRITAKNHENFDFSSDGRFVIEAPIQYDVDARVSGNSSISIAGMVSDSISAETERGDLSGTKLQAKKIKFNSSEGGSIYLLKSLQGDIEMRTAKNGSITAEKCLGTSLEMRTEDGDVSLGSNYCERALFTTFNGNLNLNNLHMDAVVDIKEKGSLNISCLDGSLQAKLQHGNAKIHVVRLTGKSQIISEGSIDLIVPRENNVRLNLRSNKMTIDESLTGTHTCSGEEQNALTGMRFTSQQVIKNWLDSFLASKDERFFRDGIHKLPERWGKVVASDGQYFD